MDTIAEFAAAKLNLYLHILGKDDRGYHLLDSLVAFATIGDELTIKPAGSFSLTIEGPFKDQLAANESNLVWRAAIVMAEIFGHKPDIAITLTKNLPLASGVGGGSADAAACIRGLCRLWNIDSGDHKIPTIALALGADVPVCLASCTAYMGGVGEKIVPLAGSLPKASIVLVNPGVDCPTKAVFEARSGNFSEAGRLANLPATTEDLVTALKENHNDLTKAALQIAPAIGTVLFELRKQGALLARMMGSGATCIGIFNTARNAHLAAQEIEDAHPFWWVKSGELL